MEPLDADRVGQRALIVGAPGFDPTLGGRFEVERHGFDGFEGQHPRVVFDERLHAADGRGEVGRAEGHGDFVARLNEPRIALDAQAQIEADRAAQSGESLHKLAVGIAVRLTE